MFYRTYRYDDYRKKWNVREVGKWNVSGNKIIFIPYESGKYDEENPDEYNILEQTNSKMTLEYYKNTPASENYKKVTFKQIATKDEMFDLDKTETSTPSIDLDADKEYPAKYLGRWENEDDGSGPEFFKNGKGRFWNKNGAGDWSISNIQDNVWFISNGLLFYNEEEEENEDIFLIYKIQKATTSQLVLEFTGYIMLEDGTIEEWNIDLKGFIDTWTNFEE